MPWELDHFTWADGSCTSQVIVLRALRSKLAEALAQVHAAASLLHLQSATATADGMPDPSELSRVAGQAVCNCAVLTAKVGHSLPGRLLRRDRLSERIHCPPWQVWADLPSAACQAHLIPTQEWQLCRPMVMWLCMPRMSSSGCWTPM